MTYTINVFINGTDEATHDITDHHPHYTSLANVLHALAKKDRQTLNICLDGCSINNHYKLDLGAIFTFHLEQQVNEIVNTIREHLNHHDNITLNLYGFSRGGAAVLWVCKKLNDIPKERLSINVSALEPVPGNFIRGTYIDNLSGAGRTLTSQISDLSDCRNINRLQILFTADPLPDIACHGPLLPVLPKEAFVTVDVTSGCHKDAELFRISPKNILSPRAKIAPRNHHSLLAFHQVIDFLEEGGLQFDFSKFELSPSMEQRAIEQKMALFDHANIEPSKRSMHFGNQITARDGGYAYFNLYHQQLAGKEKAPDECALVLNEYDPKPTYSNGLKPFGIYSLFAVTAVASTCAATCMLSSQDNEPDSFNYR